MYCSHCATANVHGATFCKSCGSAMAMIAPVAPVPVVTRQIAALARLPLKSPAGAVVLSILYPGLGQMYCGCVAKGIAMAVGVPVAIYLLILITCFAIFDPVIALLCVIGIVWIWMAVLSDAARCARTVNAARARARATVRKARAAQTL